LYNSPVEQKREDTTKAEKKPVGRLIPPVLIILCICLLGLVLFALARIPSHKIVRYEAPPVLKPINPVDQDASDIMRLALTSETPQTTLSATSRLQFLAIPDLKEGMLALKTRGLLWDYIGVLPELHYLGYEKAEAELNDYLASADLQTVVTALDALRRMPPMSCRDELLDCIKQPHADMAYYGTRVLKEWNKSDDEINKVLLNIMTIAPVASSRIAAATTLYQLGVEKEKAWAEIDRLLTNSTMDMMPSLLEFLKDSGDRRAPELMAPLLDKEQYQMVTFAAMANMKWAGKEKLLAKWDKKVSSFNQYLIYVNHEADGEKTRLSEIIASFKANKPLVEDKDGKKPKGGAGDTSLNDAQQAMALSQIANALRSWDDPRVIPYFEQLADNGPRVVRMEVVRNLRKFENNRRAIDLAIRLLETAKDDRELREIATTLGYIDNGRSLARMHDLMLQTEDEETKLTFAWAILNINRGHASSYKRR
jgi:hypothetical protein